MLRYILFISSNRGSFFFVSRPASLYHYTMFTFTEEKYITTQIYKAELDDEISLDTGVLVEVIQKNFDGWWLVR